MSINKNLLFCLSALTCSVSTVWGATAAVERANPNAPAYLQASEATLQEDLTFIQKQILTQSGYMFVKGCHEFFTKSRAGKNAYFFGTTSRAQEMYRTIGGFRANAEHTITLAKSKGTRLESETKKITEVMLMIWSDTFDLCMTPAKDHADGLARKVRISARTRHEQKQLSEALAKSAKGLSPWVERASIRLKEITASAVRAAR